MEVLHTHDFEPATGKPRLLPGEELLQTFDSIQFDSETHHSGRHELKDGHLYLTNLRAIWKSKREETAPMTAYAWEFVSIVLHAISRDAMAYPFPCIYCQLNSEEVSEIRFAPKDESALELMFSAFSHSAMLNDESELMHPVDSADQAGEWIYNADDMSPDQLNQLDVFDSMLRLSSEKPYDDGQFDDPEAEDDLL